MTHCKDERTRTRLRTRVPVRVRVRSKLGQGHKIFGTSDTDMGRIMTSDMGSDSDMGKAQNNVAKMKDRYYAFSENLSYQNIRC